ncbi:MAG: toprim domain-containing protein, partial [Microgenomates group bacterium]|nr:toprim domain-containing protein [Microgenomates group bacterium]
EGDYLEVLFERKAGYFKETDNDAVMEKVDNEGNIIGFSGRLIDNSDKTAKYINTPETLIYHKRETLFGIDLAKEAIKKQGQAVLVEGEFDVITPYQIGLENFVAIKGSAVTREQLMLLKRYTNKIILALDVDAAGEEAVKRGIEEAESLDFEIDVLTFDFAKDPDEAIRKDEKLFKKALKNPMPIYDFIIDKAIKKNPEKDPFSKKRIADEAIIYIEKIKNPIVQSHYIKKLAVLLDVAEKSIETLIKRIRQEKRYKQSFKVFRKKAEEIDREIILQKYLLSLIFQNKNPYNFCEKIFKIISIEDLAIPSYIKIIDRFLTHQKKFSDNFEANKFVLRLEPELRPVFDEIFLFASIEPDFEDTKVEKLVYELKKLSLKRNITRLLKEEEPKKDNTEEILRNLNRQLKEVEKKIATL